VAIPDLRGHGAGVEARGGRRGHLTHPGQLVEDVACLIAALAAPGQPVVLAGHSSGGGLAMRVAAGMPGLAGVVLLAPFLGHRAPTTRARSGGWARPDLPRIVALSALNALGITVLNHLTVLRFAFPRAVLDGPLGHTATSAWSWTMMRGFGPGDDVLADAARLPPFLLVAGSADAAMDAEAYAPWLSQATARGRYLVLPGAGHLSLVDDPRTATAIGDYLAGLA
jgi:alpha-beta hydrolase superfamily lysophospholipase